jgi:hypothetical protein
VPGPTTTVTKTAPPSTVIAEPEPMVVTTTETAPPDPVIEEGEPSAEELDLSSSEELGWTTDSGPTS